MKKQESNDPMVWSVIILFAVLGLGTLYHDPIAHGFIATLFGWTIEGYEANLMTGYTNVIANVNAPWYTYELFYLFPSLSIFFIVLTASILKPERFVLIAGLVLSALNLPSLNPAITGSDSAEAVRMLIAHGMSEPVAVTSHYALFILILIIYGCVLYIAVENNPTHARKRGKNIYS